MIDVERRLFYNLFIVVYVKVICDDGFEVAVEHCPGPGGQWGRVPPVCFRGGSES